MTPMSQAEIAELNAAYAYETVKANSDESTHILTHQVAVAAGLEIVREDDESGTLYRRNGRYVYGWQSGGFDDQIDQA